MSHGVKARNTRKGTGRVTPSKLRRSAVVAADGALAIGAGALGGLFADDDGHGIGDGTGHRVDGHAGTLADHAGPTCDESAGGLQQ